MRPTTWYHTVYWRGPSIRYSTNPVELFFTGVPERNKKGAPVQAGSPLITNRFREPSIKPLIFIWFGFYFHLLKTEQIMAKLLPLRLNTKRKHVRNQLLLCRPLLLNDTSKGTKTKGSATPRQKCFFDSLHHATPAQDCECVNVGVHSCHANQAKCHKRHIPTELEWWDRVIFFQRRSCRRQHLNDPHS